MMKDSWRQVFINYRAGLGTELGYLTQAPLVFYIKHLKRVRLNVPHGVLRRSVGVV